MTQRFSPWLIYSRIKPLRAPRFSIVRLSEGMELSQFGHTPQEVEIFTPKNKDKCQQLNWSNNKSTLFSWVNEIFSSRGWDRFNIWHCPINNLGIKNKKSRTTRDQNLLKTLISVPHSSANSTLVRLRYTTMSSTKDTSASTTAETTTASIGKDPVYVVANAGACQMISCACTAFQGDVREDCTNSYCKHPNTNHAKN